MAIPALFFYVTPLRRSGWCHCLEPKKDLTAFIFFLGTQNFKWPVNKGQIMEDCGQGSV